MKSLSLTASAAAISLAFSAGAMANIMSKTEYKTAMNNIQAEYKAAKTGCDPLLANEKDICRAKAKGKEQVALAELEATYRPSRKARNDVLVAKAQADYSVAIEKCDDQAENGKDVCVKEAQAVRTAARADARTKMKTSNAQKTANEKSANAQGEAEKEIAGARKDAAVDKRDAQYAVALEKCDALAGNPKDVCVNKAKKRYGKS